MQTQRPSLIEQVAAQFKAIKDADKSRLAAARAAINRANAEHSTGPKTPEGKAASCLNNTKFGLTGTNFTVLEWEDRAAFDQLLNGLREEHQPSTPTEQILVDNMAEHHWLSQRAVLLQNLCFQIEEPACQSSDHEKQLALYMRYQTTHQRAFHKCLDQLLKLRAARQKEERGFESQKQKQEIHEVRVRIAKATTEARETRKTTPTTTVRTPTVKEGPSIQEQKAAA